ncbi:chromate efflux transporter [Staphylococcus chromogenes]|nr:chromate efflux transporter [Staphylococcus chromogenes]
MHNENSMAHAQQHSSTLDVFRVFLRLGCTSFGGPTAHLGYFKKAFVDDLRWFSAADYASMVALCQFLPGPASSQVGMAIGLRRAGWLGMLAAWCAFTLPSAVALAVFGLSLHHFSVSPDTGWLQGLLAAAVAVVFIAVQSMASSLANTRLTATLAVAAGIGMLCLPYAWMQLAVLAVSGIAGVLLAPQPGQTVEPTTPAPVPKRAAMLCGALFIGLLFVLPVLATTTKTHVFDVFHAFYQSGALVFGGGHVVLPLLERQTVATGWVSQEAFLAGYSAAQAVPGPLFTLSAFLGAVDSGPWGAAVATLAIFTPSLLLVPAGLYFWQRLQQSRWAIRMCGGLNAGVVGILGAALYDPVFIHGVRDVASLGVAAVCWLMLKKWNLPPWAVAVGAAVLGWAVL